MSLDRMHINALINGIESVKAAYEAETRDEKPNLYRRRQLEILEAFIDLAKDLKKQAAIQPAELKSMVIGVYIFGLQQILTLEKKYQYLVRPDYSIPGYFYSGSRLFTLLLEYLGISSQAFKDLSNQDKLHYMAKLFQGSFISHEQNTQEKFQDRGLEPEVVRGSLSKALGRMLDVLDRKAILSALPTESAMSQKMQDLFMDYCADRFAKNQPLLQNEMRLIKILMACDALLATKTPRIEQKGFVGRSQRIRIALMLTTMQLQWDTFRFPRLYSAKGNDIVYDLCRKILNLKTIDDWRPELRVQCLSTIDWLKTNKAQLEKYANEELKIESFWDMQFEVNLDRADYDKSLAMFNQAICIDPLINQLTARAESMIHEINLPSGTSTQVAFGLALLLAVAASIPGYGVGWTLAELASHTDAMVAPKIALSKATNGMLCLMAGKEAENYVGHFLASMLIDATLKRGAEVVCEGVCMALTGLAAFGITIIVTKITAEVLTGLYEFCCKSYLYMNLAKDMDERFVETMLSMPPEILKESKKEKFRYLTQGVLFQPAKEIENKTTTFEKREDGPALGM